MLKNKTEQTIKLVYNGIDKEVPPGGKIDVRDFDISIGQNTSVKELVPKVEKHIVKKNPGLFEIVPDDSLVAINKDAADELAVLKRKIDELQKAVSSERSVNLENSKKLAEQAEEINGFEAKEMSLKSKVKKLEADIKDMEEEHKAHIARLMGGKK